MKIKVILTIFAVIFLLGGIFYFGGYAKNLFVNNDLSTNDGEDAIPEESINMIFVESHEDARFVEEYAQDRGFFKKNNLRVDRVTVEKGANTVLAADGGVLIGSNTGYIRGYLNGADFRLLANVFYSFTSFDLSRYPFDRDGVKKIKRAALTISSAFNGEEHILYLKSLGADIGGIEFVKMPSLAAKERALSKGEVDFIDVTSEVFMDEIGGYQKYNVAGPGDIFKDTGKYFSKGIITTQKTLVQKPEALKRFVKSIYEAIEEIKRDEAGSVAFLMDKYGMNESRAKEFYKRFLEASFGIDFVPGDDFSDRVIDKLREAGTEIDILDNLPKDYVNSDFAKEVFEKNTE